MITVKEPKAFDSSKFLPDIFYQKNNNVQQTNEQIFSKRYIARLNEGLASKGSISDDMTERLKAARNRAIANRKISVIDSKFHGRDTAPWNIRWPKFLDLLDLLEINVGHRLHATLCAAPLVMLMAGLFVVADVTKNETVEEKAIVDIKILVDSLPPEAYLDRGFVQFMKQTRN